MTSPVTNSPRKTIVNHLQSVEQRKKIFEESERKRQQEAKVKESEEVRQNLIKKFAKIDESSVQSKVTIQPEFISKSVFFT